MSHQYAVGIAAIAAITGALALNGCDQHSGQASTNSPDVVANGAPSSTQKMGTAVDDSATTAKVKAALLGDPGLRSLQIDVVTIHGDVTLSGTVDTPDMRNHAKQVASGVAGVNSVIDQMMVKNSG